MDITAHQSSSLNCLPILIESIKVTSILTYQSYINELKNATVVPPERIELSSLT